MTGFYRGALGCGGYGLGVRAQGLGSTVASKSWPKPRKFYKPEAPRPLPKPYPKILNPTLLKEP